MTLDMQCHKGKPLHSLGFLSCQWDAFDVCYNICCKRDGRVLGAWVWSFCRFDWRRKRCCQKYCTGRRYPLGPTCTFNGHHVPTFCCCSESGSITAELLVQMLKTADKIGVFDRTDRVPPSLSLMAMVAASTYCSCNTSTQLQRNGVSALGCHMAHHTGRLGTFQNKMVHLKWHSKNARETYY